MKDELRGDGLRSATAGAATGQGVDPEVEGGENRVKVPKVLEVDFNGGMDNLCGCRLDEDFRDGEWVIAQDPFGPCWCDAEVTDASDSELVFVEQSGPVEQGWHPSSKQARAATNQTREAVSRPSSVNDVSAPVTENKK